MKPPPGLSISLRPRLWCLTHDCWDGDCGVLGVHEVEPCHAVTLPSGFTSRDDFLDACERAGVDVTEWRGENNVPADDNGGTS